MVTVKMGSHLLVKEIEYLSLLAASQLTKNYKNLLELYPRLLYVYYNESLLILVLLQCNNVLLGFFLDSVVFFFLLAIHTLFSNSK